jgi:hypothetical protein
MQPHLAAATAILAYTLCNKLAIHHIRLMLADEAARAQVWRLHGVNRKPARQHVRSL